MTKLDNNIHTTIEALIQSKKLYESTGDAKYLKALDIMLNLLEIDLEEKNKELKTMIGGF